jgi:hypothetical protein
MGQQQQQRSNKNKNNTRNGGSSRHNNTASSAITRRSSSPLILSASVSPCGRLTSLLLWCPSAAVPLTGYVWLHHPRLGAAEWHPFEFIAVPAQLPDDGSSNVHHDSSSNSGGGCAAAAAVQPALLLHIKGYGRWTDALLSLLSKEGAQGLSGLRLEGPYPELPGPALGWQQYSCCWPASPLDAAAGGGGAAAATASDKPQENPTETSKGGNARTSPCCPELPDGLVIVAGNAWCMCYFILHCQP